MYSATKPKKRKDGMVEYVIEGGMAPCVIITSEYSDKKVDETITRLDTMNGELVKNRQRYHDIISNEFYQRLCKLLSKWMTFREIWEQFGQPTQSLLRHRLNQLEEDKLIMCRQGKFKEWKRV